MSCEDKPDEDPRPATRPTMSTQTNMYQGEDRIWTDFQNLLARTHVQHAIYESASDYNEIPTVCKPLPIHLPALLRNPPVPSRRRPPGRLPLPPLSSLQRPPILTPSPNPMAPISRPDPRPRHPPRRPAVPARFHGLLLPRAQQPRRQRGRHGGITHPAPPRPHSDVYARSVRRLWTVADLSRAWI